MKGGKSKQEMEEGEQKIFLTIRFKYNRQSERKEGKRNQKRYLAAATGEMAALGN